MWCMDGVVLGLCGVWTVWCMNCVVYGLCGVWTMWCMNCVVYGLCGVWTVWCMDCVVYGLCGVWTVWFLHCVVCGLCGVRTMWCMVCDVFYYLLHIWYGVWNAFCPFYCSTYSTDDLLTWNRTTMIPPDTEVIKCANGWVYDQSTFESTLVSQVDEYLIGEYLLKSYFN